MHFQVTSSDGNMYIAIIVLARKIKYYSILLRHFRQYGKYYRQHRQCRP